MKSVLRFLPLVEMIVWDGMSGSLTRPHEDFHAALFRMLSGLALFFIKEETLDFKRTSEYWQPLVTKQIGHPNDN